MKKEKTELQRRISLEDDFMNYSTDDILFGVMYYLATFHPEEKKLYLTKKTFTKNKACIYDLCDLNSQKLKRHLKKLADAGLIKEEDIKVGEEKLPCYTFPYDYTKKYQLIENDMLWYICSTRNKQAVRLYSYLLNCYKWKLKENSNYEFSYTTLVHKLGYSTKSVNALAIDMVSNILESLKREGIIDYEDFYEEKILDCGKTVPVPKKRLLFVASSKAEIKN